MDNTNTELVELDTYVSDGPLAMLEPDDYDIPLAERSWTRFQLRIEELERTTPQAPPWWQVWLTGRVGLVVAMACLLMVSMPWVYSSVFFVPNDNKTDMWKVKGAPVFDMLVASPTMGRPTPHTTPALVRRGQSLRPGDFVQFRYKLPRTAHVMVVSLNDKGDVFAYFPLEGKQSRTLHAGEGTLPENKSWELDDVLGEEKFFVIASKEPFSYKQVKSLLRKSFQYNKGRVGEVGLSSRTWWYMSLLVHKRK